MSTDVVLLSDAVLATLSAKLRRWKPSRPIGDRRAEVFLTSEAWTRVEAPWTQAPGQEPLRQATRAALDQYIEHGSDRLRMFHPAYGRSGIAQMKVMAPNPGVRLFGGFVDTTCFVGIRLYRRDELPYKATGQRGGIDYKTLGEEMVLAWDALLPTVARRLMRDF